MQILESGRGKLADVGATDERIIFLTSGMEIDSSTTSTTFVTLNNHRAIHFNQSDLNIRGIQDVEWQLSASMSNNGAGNTTFARIGDTFRGASGATEGSLVTHANTEISAVGTTRQRIDSPFVSAANIEALLSDVGKVDAGTGTYHVTGINIGLRL